MPALSSPLRRRSLAAALSMGLGLGLLATASAHAEGQLRVAQQFGIAYLILDVVKDQQLVEKHGKAQGLAIDVQWHQISGATAMNEALLAGSLDVVSAGVPPMLTLWDRTRGKQNVKAVAALGALPNYLLTTNAGIRSLADFSDKDRIAVPAAGTGFQSRTLQIESAKVFGAQQYKKLDAISVSLPHPDATAALISGGTEINSHFSSAPFYYQALAQNPKIRKVISSYDILGGPATFNVLYTTQRFHDRNPQTYRAFYAALREAAAFIRKDPAQAAEIFIRVQKSKLDPALVRQIIEDPENQFTADPQNSFIYARELHKIGVLQHPAASWKDYFFSEAHAHPGS